MSGRDHPPAGENPVRADDLIVARATAAGTAALAIVRLDGARAADLVASIFRSAAGPSPVESPRRMILGRWIDPAAPDETIDEGLTVFFRAPHSFTGNDVVEFHCHGGPVPARRLVETALRLGARPAQPGEFTRRAFLNGRLDLAQAEAVAELINAQTDAAARVARRHLEGALSRQIDELRAGLITLAAEIEARIDFPEEDLEPEDAERLSKAFDGATDGLAALLATRRRGRLLREGARVALVGRPNAGKSSLLNALARRERSIVTPHPGTTRDTVECTIDLGGVPLVLVDTAGLRASDDPVERLGIERAHREIDHADLVVLVRDMTQPESTLEDEEQLGLVRSPDLVALNKSDLNNTHGIAPVLPSQPSGSAISGPPRQPISALTGEGLAELEHAILDLLLYGTGGEEDLAVNLRQGELLERAATALAAARRAFAETLSGEFVMVDLRESIDALSAVLGVETGEAILDQVFSRFCIGK